LFRLKTHSLMTLSLYWSGASAAAPAEVAQFEAVPPIVVERSFDGEQL
jgi:hypothetical protein